MPSADRHTDETRPLLHHGDSRPESYHSVDSDDTQPPEPEPADPSAKNNVSRADLFWVLAGLWSAVFLGALDGACAFAYPFA